MGRLHAVSVSSDPGQANGHERTAGQVHPHRAVGVDAGHPLDGHVPRVDDVDRPVALAEEHGQDQVGLDAENATVPGVVELYCTLSAEATAPDHPAHGYFARRYETTRQSFVRAFTAMKEQGRLRLGRTPVAPRSRPSPCGTALQVQWLLDPATIGFTAR